MLRRLLTTLAGAALLVAPVTVGTLLASPVPAGAAAAPQCPLVTIQDSSKAAMAVFSGTVSEVERQPRTDGQPGALYLQTVTVDLVYQGSISTETVEVQTDRNRLVCSLGELAVGTEYMFFVTGSGDPWVASGTSGTRPNDDSVATEVEGLLGAGETPIEPVPEAASFTPVGAGEPRPLSRTAAPGVALVIVGLLGLLLVRGLGRRTR